MDMLPLSAMSQEGRETWYRTDMAQLNEERQTTNATALDPNSQETRDQLHGIQVANQERSFPFCDKLSTWMFILASELSEAPLTQ